RLAASQALQGRLKSVDLEMLEELDRRQVATGDGAKSLSEWTAARLDLSQDSAKSLVQTMRRTAQRRDLRELLAAGEISFDRVEALSRISEEVGLLRHLDVAGVLSEAAKRVRITAEDEVRSADDQFLVMQPSLDESSWRLWGGLDGYSGAIVDKALTEAADQLPTLPDGSRGDSSWRKANALVQLCVSDETPPAQVTVFVDTKQAVESNAETGVVLEAGPRVGKQALEAVLCDATVEVTARAEDGTPMVYGRSQRTAPPALKRALLYESEMMCQADGCTSRYRLQIHHVNSWAQGGETNPEDLIVLCWFHHQVVIHQRGYHIYRHPDHGRIRFRAPDTPARPPPI
ncbi:MAG: HNH endonuclease, partial [Acidimicrobiia bacterium]